MPRQNPNPPGTKHEYASRLRFHQHTEHGELTVERHRDDNYPGFTFSLNNKQIGVLEYVRETGEIRLMGWCDGASEDDDAHMKISIASRKERPR